MLTNRSKQNVYSHTAGITLALLTAAGAHAQSVPVTLGQASSFGVLAGSTVTNTGPSVVYGNVGVSTGSSITGFPPGTVSSGGALHANDSLAMGAQTDLATAYDVIAGETATDDLTGQDLGGMTLTPGVYHFSSAAQLTGQLTLDAQGDPNARFDFQIGSTLTTDFSSSVSVTNGGSADDVFWQVGSSATLGADTTFKGNLLAMTSITLVTGATDSDGRTLARNGAVTLDSNTVGLNNTNLGSNDAGDTSAPEPCASAYLILLGPPAIIGLVRRRRGK